MAYRLLNNAFEKFQFRFDNLNSHTPVAQKVVDEVVFRRFSYYKLSVAKCAAVICSSAQMKISDFGKSTLEKAPTWCPETLNDLLELPCVVIFYGDVNGFSQFHFPSFSYVDSRLILDGYFSRKELEAEFILATSYTKSRKGPERSADEIRAAQVLQVNKKLNCEQKVFPFFFLLESPKNCSRSSPRGPMHL